MRTKQILRISAAVLFVALVASVAAPVAEARGDVQLRVEVDDPRTGEQRVRLNLPLRSIDQLLAIASQQMDEEHEFDFNLDMGNGMNMRALYTVFRDEDLTDLLQVNGEDGENVRVWKDRDAFHVEVQEEGYYEPNIRIYLPLQVLDVLFMEGDELDMSGALEELRRMAPLTLVEVDTEEETVRVWLE
jgi:hypothetical protein